MLDQFIELLPAEKREEYKTAISKAVIVGSKEDAERVLREHPLVKSTWDAEVSRKYAEIEKRYQDEKLPKIVEDRLAEERKKGQKQPWEVETEKLRAELEATKRQTVIEKQKARALLKAQEQGLPVELVERFVGETDEATDEALKALAGVLKPWQEKAVKESLAKFGSMPDPQAGNMSGKAISRNDFAKLDPASQMKMVKEGYKIHD
jgi:hypothetical protein